MMIIQVMISYKTNQNGEIVDEETFIPYGERKEPFTVLGCKDHYFDQESGQGYEIWEVSTEKATNIVKYIGGVKHRLVYDTELLFNTWEPIE